MSLFRLIFKIGIDSTEYVAGLKKAESGMEALAKKAKEYFTVAAIEEFTRKTLEMVGHIKDLSEQFEISTDQVQQLQVAAGKAGLEFENYGQILSKIKKAQADFAAGDAGAQKLFSRLGIDPSDKAFDILKQLSSVRDMAAVFDLIGVKSAKVVSSLKEIKKLGPMDLISREQIERLDKVDKQFSQTIRQAKILGAFMLDLTNNRSTPARLKQFADDSIAFAQKLIYGENLNGSHSMGKKRMAEEESMYNYVDWMKGKQTADAPQMSTLADLAKLKSKDGFSRIDMGDRANVGGFFGPNSNLNSKLTRLGSNVEKMTKAMEDVRDTLKSQD